MAIELTPANVERQQQRALLRLQVRVTGETHKMFYELFEWLAGRVAAATDEEGNVDGARLARELATAAGRWVALHDRWHRLLMAARAQAASLPFGALVVLHNAAIGGALQERLIGREEMQSVIALWLRRRNRALSLAAERIYSDGFRLSERVWRLREEGLAGIRSTLATAMAERTNAADLARRLESMLGMGEDCPRWTMTRLYRMGPPERLASTRGLVRGEECAGQGVAYRALRMARNEIQIAHHQMSDEIARNSPWVTGEKIMLSAGHPERDICDEYAEGGPYRPGEVTLPLHVQCMCWKKTVQMPRAEFNQNLRGWLRGENTFLNGYAEWSGVRQPVTLPSTMGIAETLQFWLSNNAGGHAEALGL